MTIAIIDYGSGNLRSAEKAVLRTVQDLGLDREVLVTSDADRVAGADHILLPGVGAFGDCIRGLRAVDGMVDCLNQRVIQGGVPFLGICVGMQLMAEEGHEHGIFQGLGWITGQIKPITVSQDLNLKVPHMGWNEIRISPGQAGHPLLDGLTTGDHMYFVHSYQYDNIDESQVMATTDYGGNIPAVVGRDNLFGTQFHPEKSQQAGLRLIGNFLKWRP
ncbi:imidazole glycerol phosphate synthase subunit HisH [Paremcibacter congregatus]|uniref:Imidazole glycerol phosphate synthase subunit HisH n=1 Tax=Paremcibacter congregatus TaxID=2043170 RepID=A0A2G4YRV6_9PROT|nr:imidazole glycerol phosphate synthase subunit HisH [Paremcibacter congregatus]PHZ85043.1 imidazole glycerol phosphate synthase subunit HisH [Paremcibacter congregatus]QDE25982.1 imidazole glycerol phosphate synthase subunit HisH [Paremcibacter congregatus]